MSDLTPARRELDKQWRDGVFDDQPEFYFELSRELYEFEERVRANQQRARIAVYLGIVAFIGAALLWVLT